MSEYPGICYVCGSINTRRRGPNWCTFKPRPWVKINVDGNLMNAHPGCADRYIEQQREDRQCRATEIIDIDHGY